MDRGYCTRSFFASLTAKFSRGLIKRIYQHAKEMGWIKPGDVCMDPFGGVSLGGLEAMINGLQWVGIELEAKFIALGQQNIELWNRKLKGWPGLGTARILQGDSRKIKDVIREASLIVSSPPYAETPIEQTHMTSNKRGDSSNPNYRPSWKKKLSEGYADTKRPYGKTEGQLGDLPEGNFQDVIEGASIIISSPPFATGDSASAQSLESRKDRSANWIKNNTGWSTGYGSHPSNLGNQSGTTFWEASFEILQGCFDLLKDNGMAIFVCKDYIKAGKRVPFSNNWLALCESVGFKLVCRHKAMLVKEHGFQITLDGGEQKLQTERKSFFRRDHETKKMAVLFWDTVTDVEQANFIEWASGQIEPYSKKKVLLKAQVKAFQTLCIDDTPYRDERNIDWEDILCLRKEEAPEKPSRG